MANWLEAFEMREGETVRGVLADYDAVALITDEPKPEAPVGRRRRAVSRAHLIGRSRREPLTSTLLGAHLSI